MGFNWMLEKVLHHVMYNTVRKPLQGSLQILILQTNFHQSMKKY